MPQPLMTILNNTVHTGRVASNRNNVSAVVSKKRPSYTLTIYNCKKRTANANATTAQPPVRILEAEDP